MKSISFSFSYYYLFALSLVCYLVSWNRKIVFGATCCLGQTNSPWYNLAKAAEERLDFFLLLGDTTYADSSQSLTQFMLGILFPS
jgi:hypothetical protein